MSGLAVHVRQYTVRGVAAEDLDPIVWRSESTYMPAPRACWLVDLWRNGHPFAHDLDPDAVAGAIKLSGGRDAKIAARIARTLRSK